ncbi:MAG: M24 family metallopeptidase [Alphaproteobacteria bacterium]|nr:MAG: M24 family metallopeptidase [Alphaproteobacteria bacterium]
MALYRLLKAAYYGSLTVEGFAQTSKVTQAMIREVADYDPVNSSVLMAPWAAPRSGQPHSIPEFSDTLKAGPHVALVLTRVNGYSAEVERTFFTASPDSWSRAAFAAMMEARRRIFAMIRPGQSCAEIDRSANEFLASEGFLMPEERLHRTGHGFGLGAHEAPWIAEGSDHVLEENMVISNEPGIYCDGFGGVRHSDTVLVTRNGYELLTTSPTDIETLTLPSRPSFRQRIRGRLIRKALNI